MLSILILVIGNDINTDTVSLGLILVFKMMGYMYCKKSCCSGMVAIIELCSMNLTNSLYLKVKAFYFYAVADILMETFKRATTAPAQAANLLTMMRAITNLFKHSYFSHWLQSHYSEVSFPSPSKVSMLLTCELIVS